MPTRIVCPRCQRHLIAPEGAGGLRVNCPACQAIIDVPLMLQPSTTMPVSEMWYVLAHDGQQYGPLTRTQLDCWYAEGRLAPHSQVLREGDTAWQWATVLYPGLMQPQRAPVGQVTRPPRARPTEVVSLVALLNYLICGALVIGAVVIFAAMVRLGQVEDERQARLPNRVSAQAVGGMAGAVLGAIPLVLAIPYGIAGYGVTSRRQWGRVFTFILAGLSVLPALLGIAVFGVTALTMVFAREPIPGNFLVVMFSALGATVLFIGYIACAFNVLVRERYAAEFR